MSMNQKAQRFATIRKIIRNEAISSQDELIARLNECGIEITQSTLSRDLKFMNVAKVPHKNKGYIILALSYIFYHLCESRSAFNRFA